MRKYSTNREQWKLELLNINIVVIMVVNGARGAIPTPESESRSCIREKFHAALSCQCG